MIAFADWQIKLLQWPEWVMLALLLVAFSISLRGFLRRVPKQQVARRAVLLACNLLALIALAGLLLSPKIKSPDGVTLQLITDSNNSSAVNDGESKAGTFYYSELNHKSNLNFAGSKVSDTENTLQDPQQLLLRYPNLERLQVFGDGLYAPQWQVFKDVAIDYQSPLKKTGLIEINWPRTLNLGDYLNIKGRVQSTESGILSLSLLDPAGDLVESKNLRGGEYFKFTARPKAGGLQTYRLVLQNDQQVEIASESLHFAVTENRGVKILVIQSAPSFEIKHLQNYVAEYGGQLLVQTQISRGRYSSRQVNLPQLKNPEIDAALLAQFDLLIVDGRSLAINDAKNQLGGLNENQRSAIDKAISDGLGVIVLADQSLLMQTNQTNQTNQTTQTTQTTDFPAVSVGKVGKAAWLDAFQLRATQQSADVLAAWSDNSDGMLVPSEIPTPRIAAEFITEDVSPLVQTATGIPLVEKHSYGLGQVALSLLRETYRWSIAGEKAAHSHYWQNVIRNLARPRVSNLALDLSSSKLYFNNQRSEICVTSETEIQNLSVQPLENSHVHSTLKLEPRDSYSGSYCGYFWPQYSGWFQVGNAQSQGAAQPLWLYVEDAESWQAIRQQQKITATLKQQKWNEGHHPKTALVSYLPVNSWIFWWLFLLSASLIWLEGKWRVI